MQEIERIIKITVYLGRKNIKEVGMDYSYKFKTCFKINFRGGAPVSLPGKGERCEVQRTVDSSP